MESSYGWEMEETARRAAELVQRFGIKPNRVVYDRSGLGEGFGAMLRNAGITGAIGFLGGSEARGHQKKFENLKSASAWQLRTRLNPAQTADPFAIPPELAAQLRPELQAYTYETTGKDKNQLTDKKTITARLGRSPDLADALIMSFVAIDRGAA